jgi:hypothetical protein
MKKKSGLQSTFFSPKAPAPKKTKRRGTASQPLRLLSSSDEEDNEPLPYSSVSSTKSSVTKPQRSLFNQPQLARTSSAGKSVSGFDFLVCILVRFALNLE